MMKLDIFRLRRILRLHEKVHQVKKYFINVTMYFLMYFSSVYFFFFFFFIRSKKLKFFHLPVEKNKRFIHLNSVNVKTV